MFPILLSAINLKQVEVEFNSASLLDEDEASDVDNYTFVDENDDDVAVADVSLVDNVATVTLASAVDNQDTLYLTVEDDILGEDTDFEVYFFDTTIPKVLDAKVVGESTVKVIFSEPINFEDQNLDAKDAFDFNDGEYFVKEVEPLNNNTEANVKLYSALDEGNLEIAIDNILEDYAGFNVVPTTLNISVTEDEDEPVIIGYKDAARNKVTLIFNEDIMLANDVTEDDFYHTNSSNTVDNDIEDDTTPEADLGAVVSGNELTLYFEEENQLPEGVAYIYIDGEAILDLWGNANSNTIRYKIEVEIDQTKPEVDKITVLYEDKIKVIFTEELNTSTVKKSDFTLLDEDGKEADLIKDVEANGKNVVIEFTKDLSGDYFLVVEDVEDLSGNEIEKETVSFTVDDLTAPVISQFTATLYFAANATDNDNQPAKLVINFKEPMSVEGKYSVVDLEKYVLEDTELADLDDVKIKAIDGNKKVEIIIPCASDDSDGMDLNLAAARNDEYQIQIARVADAAGNYTTLLADTIDVTAQGYVGISSVKATAVNKIVVTFSDQFDDFESSDIKFKVNETELDIAGVSLSTNSDGNSVATYRLADNLGYDAKSGSNSVVLDVVDNDSVNRYGESLDVSIDDKTVEDKIRPELVETNAIVQTSIDAFKLTFTENVDADNDVLAATDLVIVDEDGDQLVAGTDYTVETPGDNTVVVTLTETGDYTAYEGTLTISTASSVNYIKDTTGNDNKIAEIDDEEIEFDGVNFSD